MAAGHAHHAHDHHHHHHHAPADFGRAFLIGILLNTGFVAVEATAGVLAGSMALIADAGHNLSDVLGLVIAWGAAALSRRGPTARYTYGLRRSSIMAALVNAVVLMIAVGAMAFEALRRLADPAPVDTGLVVAVAAAGILVNGITAALFARGRKHDLNVRGAFLHMAADAAVSAGVVIAALVVGMTGWLWLDPAVSLLIGAVIVAGTWGLLRDSLSLSLDAVPAGIETAQVADRLAALSGVAAVHDLHIWAMSTTEVALTCHLVMPEGHPGDDFLRAASDMLQHDFGIGHATIQVERSEDFACPQAPAEAV